MYFIVFEGLDGCGKTTMAKRLTAWLESQNKAVCHTREIGGTPFAEQVRNLIMSMHDIGYDLDKTCEALLCSAARYDHIQRVILPSLHDEKIVICERFYFSTLVYQYQARFLSEIVNIGLHGDKLRFTPDLTIYLKTDYNTSRSRLNKRPNDAMDDKGEVLYIHRQERLEIALQHHAIDYPGSLVTIDAGMSEDDVFNAIQNVVSELFAIDSLSLSND